MCFYRQACNARPYFSGKSKLKRIHGWTMLYCVIVPSEWPTKRHSVPRGNALHTKHVAHGICSGKGGACSTKICVLSSRSHTSIATSVAIASQYFEGQKATAFTEDKVGMSQIFAPSWRSHMMTRASFPPEAINEASGLAQTQWTTPLWSSNSLTNFRLRTSQSFTLWSQDAESNQYFSLPSWTGTKDKAEIQSWCRAGSQEKSPNEYFMSAWAFHKSIRTPPAVNICLSSCDTHMLLSCLSTLPPTTSSPAAFFPPTFQIFILRSQEQEIACCPSWDKWQPETTSLCPWQTLFSTEPDSDTNQSFKRPSREADNKRPKSLFVSKFSNPSGSEATDNAVTQVLCRAMMPTFSSDMNTKPQRKTSKTGTKAIFCPETKGQKWTLGLLRVTVTVQNACSVL